MMRPEKTRPRLPPIPNTADSNPMPTFTSSGGNSSLMIPKLRGKTAAPAPAATRNPISEPMSQANAQPTEPRKNSARLITSKRSLPNWSPSFPRIGVNTAALSRNPVKTHVTQVVDVPRSCSMAGRAGTTIVCCSAYEVAASVRIASVTL